MAIETGGKKVHVIQGSLNSAGGRAVQPPVRAAVVTSARSGVAGGGVITLAVVASRANVIDIWASLNSNSAATPSASFQHLVVGMLRNHFGFAANLTVGQLWVGKTAGECFVCRDPDVCDKTASYDTQCGSKLTPPQGFCVWDDDAPPGHQNTCECELRFTGPHCHDLVPTPAPPGLTVDAAVYYAVGLTAGCLSIIVSCYAMRKACIARLRKRHRPSINGDRPTGKFDCRDGITISLLCGSFLDEDELELVDPLVPVNGTTESTRTGCLCCRSSDGGGDDENNSVMQQPCVSGAFTSVLSAQSVQSRDEVASAQSAATSKAHGQ
jgi:hypothetical protein